LLLPLSHHPWLERSVTLPTEDWEAPFLLPLLYASWLAVFTYRINRKAVGMIINRAVAINPRILTSIMVSMCLKWFHTPFGRCVFNHRHQICVFSPIKSELRFYNRWTSLFYTINVSPFNPFTSKGMSNGLLLTVFTEGDPLYRNLTFTEQRRFP
jgi:hypothetical protein